MSDRSCVGLGVVCQKDFLSSFSSLQVLPSILFCDFLSEIHFSFSLQVKTPDTNASIQLIHVESVGKDTPDLYPEPCLTL